MSQGPAVAAAGTGLTGMETVWSRGELLCTPALSSKSLVGFNFGVPSPHIPATMRCVTSPYRWHPWVPGPPTMPELYSWWPFNTSPLYSGISSSMG